MQNKWVPGMEEVAWEEEGEHISIGHNRLI